MASTKTESQLFLESEVNKVKGIYYPVKAGFLRRRLIKKVSCRKLHPNPNDEFCFPEIGPNYGIISQYEADYRRFGTDFSNLSYTHGGIAERIMIEKTRPEGYMILNGHHRWAAALRTGIPRLPVRIVDLTQESDIRKMLETAGFDKRVTLDLDGVVFRPDSETALEKPLPFPVNRYFRERLRLGIPSLFFFLKEHGYDIWIYTSGYYSLEYLQHYFKQYRIHVTGIVTGTARKAGPGVMKNLVKMTSEKYKSTIHIDNHTVLQTFTGSRDFRDYPLTGSDATWSREIMDIIGALK